jgi:hypothetical protein
MTDEKMLDMIDQEFGQPSIYMWSTYILPNGNFLNPMNSKDLDEEELAYEHSDFEGWAVSAFGNKGFRVFETHCIKMNVTYPYLALPTNRITPAQAQSIKKIVNSGDFEYDRDGIGGWLDHSNDNPYEMEQPLLVLGDRTEKVFDLAVYNASEITKEIMKAYSVGSFLEAKQDIIPGTEVAEYMLDISRPGYEPDYYVGIVMKRNFVLKEIQLEDLIKNYIGTDQGALDYIEDAADHQRYTKDEDGMYIDDDYSYIDMGDEDIYNPIVIVDGKLLDGYSRVSEHIHRLEEDYIWAYVAV